MPARLALGMQRLGLTVAKVVFRINQARTEQGSELLGDAGLRYWMRGDREPSMEDIRMLAQIMECDPGWLAFGGACEAKPPKWWPEGAPEVKPTPRMDGSAARVALKVTRKHGKGRRAADGGK